jgi:uncharacterized repeat protein (TIGR01451 family)
MLCGLTIISRDPVNYTGAAARWRPSACLPVWLPQPTISALCPPGQLSGIRTATGQQTNRVTRNDVPSVCGVQKTFTGTTITAGTRTFDSYSFAACKSACVTPVLTSGNGVNIFEVAYAGTFDPANISTNYAADPGLSGSPQSFEVSTTASNTYTIVVADVPGTATGTSYSLQLPACVLNCNINQVPVAQAHDVTATSAIAGGSANASIDNGSFDPDGDTLTITQSPAGPYPHGNTPVLLTVTDTNGATSQASAVVTVTDAVPPAIAKAFGAASINLNGTTTLTFTITNSNALALTGVAFGDTLPARLAVANQNGLTGSCGSGTITTGTVSGFSVVNLAGGTIAASDSCTFSVNVVGTTSGHKVNTTGTVISDNAGSGNQATAAIDVVAPDLTITEAHTGNFNRPQNGATYTITVNNAGFGPTSGAVTVTDTLPNVQNTLVATAISGTGWSCTLATLTCTRSDALASGSSYPAITLTVNVPQNIQANVTNSAAVSGGSDVNTGNNSASDPTHIGAPLQIASNNNTSTLTITSGSSASMDFTVDSSNGIGAVTFACTGLPAASSCSFNPQSESQLTATVSMTITTTKSGTATPVAFNPPTMLYVPLVSFVGLLGFILYSMKSFRPRMRLAMFAASVIVLLALAGCGSNGLKGTPKGTFPVTVTASGTGAQATVTLNLTVQ